MGNYTTSVYNKRPIDKLIESKAGIITVAILGIIMSLVFILIPGNPKMITREEAVAYTGEFQEYEISEDLRCIYFADGSQYYVYPHIAHQNFQNRMADLPVGTTLYILVNPYTDDVLEVRTDSEELMNFDAEQGAIRKYANGYVWLGGVFLLLSAFLIWFAFKQSASKKQEQELQDQKEARRENGFDDTAIRRADFSVKHRIFLEQKVGEYTICYRRVKSVNELVINGLVYDEKKAIVEFAHTLSASINGHLIEAGLDASSYSFIAIDQTIVAQKKRLI